MSDLRIEKRRVTVTVTLTAGHHFTGSLFLSGQAATHAGPERLIDLLNVNLGNEDLVAARERISAAIEAFTLRGERTTANLDFDG